MCGIWALIQQNKINQNKLFEDYMRINPRGPDNSHFQSFNNVFIGFHRLAIMDPRFHANQPYILEDGDRTIVFICNGEIYNFKELIDEYNLEIPNNSDCMVIPKLYIKMTKFENDMDNFIELFKYKINGEFGFVIFEFNKLQNLNKVIIGRDMVGVRPLYYHPPTINTSNNLIFSSEVKGTINYDKQIKEFPPGNICCISFDDMKKIDNISHYNFETIYMTKQIDMTDEIILFRIRQAVINSIKRRLVADRPIAFLLSGGVDSSLVAGISSRLLGQPIRTFCCGMNEGTDLIYARLVAEHIGSDHKEIYFTPEEGLDAIDDVIRTVETWDTTTIRASVGQYIVCKHIGTKTDARVVMVGEGPDEVCSSYLFNYNAPTGEELDKTAKEYVNNIHKYDVKRADRCIARWGLEGRVAFLDPEFIREYWSILAEKRHPKYKGIEKYWLREAFARYDIIPDKVLWRKKEAFSDGVSGHKKSWYQYIQEYVETKDFILNDAPTKEAQYYKAKFIEYFGNHKIDIIDGYWQPKWTINKGYIDPSARTLDVYSSTS